MYVPIHNFTHVDQTDPSWEYINTILEQNSKILAMNQMLLTYICNPMVTAADVDVGCKAEDLGA
jgi:hypothetical protein